MYLAMYLQSLDSATEIRVNRKLVDVLFKPFSLMNEDEVNQAKAIYNQYKDRFTNFESQKDVAVILDDSIDSWKCS